MFPPASLHREYLCTRFVRARVTCKQWKGIHQGHRLSIMIYFDGPWQITTIKDRRFCESACAVSAQVQYDCQRSPIASFFAQFVHTGEACIIHDAGPGQQGGSCS